MTERGLTTDRFSSQSASAELIEWFALPKRETIVLEGLYSSAKAFAIASAAKKGIHTVLLNNREDAAYCSSDLYSLMGKERVFFFPSSLNHSAKGDKKRSFISGAENSCDTGP